MGWLSDLLGDSDSIDKVIDDTRLLKFREYDDVDRDTLVDLRVRMSNCIERMAPEFDRQLLRGDPPPQFRHTHDEIMRTMDILQKLIRLKTIDAWGGSYLPDPVEEFHMIEFHKLLNEL
jgi:hypothetical protein